MSRIVVWEPSSKKMLDDYPELKKIEEFKGLKDYQLKFCWFYANPTSPLIKKLKEIGKQYTLEDRRREAVEKTFEGQSEIDREKFIKGEYSEEIKAALKRMQNTKVRDRVVAKRLFDSGYKNIEVIINRSPSEIEQLEMKDQKTYMSMFLEFTKSMDDIIEKREQAYGVKVKENNKNENSTQEFSIDSIIKDQAL